jgi:two-component system, OmpR family, phosphate regulon response regulator PhoB
MNRYRILVVEDEADIRELIVLHLNREGHLVDQTSSGAEALEMVKSQEYDLLVLDWMLPERSGLEVVRELRKSKGHDALAVLMVTAKSANADLILGLESGADDYLVKPFELSVLTARARALLRRTEGSSQNQIEFGALQIDESAHLAKVQGKELALTPYEFRLLLTLAQNKGRVLTRDRLIQEVQGSGVAVVERAIDTHVFGLRKKLGECADLIETVRGVGYRIGARA